MVFAPEWRGHFSTGTIRVGFRRARTRRCHPGSRVAKNSHVVLVSFSSISDPVQRVHRRERKHFLPRKTSLASTMWHKFRPVIRKMCRRFDAIITRFNFHRAFFARRTRRFVSIIRPATVRLPQVSISIDIPYFLPSLYRLHSPHPSLEYRTVQTRILDNILISLFFFTSDTCENRDVPCRWVAF